MVFIVAVTFFPACFLFKYSHFLPPSKDMQVGLAGDFKLSVSENMSVFVFSVTKWRFTYGCISMDGWTLLTLSSCLTVILLKKKSYYIISENVLKVHAFK